MIIYSRRQGLTFVSEGSDFFKEVVVVAEIWGDFSGVHVEDFRREFSYEMDVVADEYKCALVAPEG